MIGIEPSKSLIDLLDRLGVVLQGALTEVDVFTKHESV
jgi:hypothetical protein